MLPAQLGRHGIHPPPLALPRDMPRAFHLTHPVFVHALNAAGELQRQHSIIEGIVGLRKMPLLLELRHHLEGHLRPLFIAQAMEEMVKELQDAPAGSLHVGIAFLDSLLQVRDLLFVPIRLLDHHLDAIKTLAICHHGGHNGLILRHPPLDMVPGLLYPPNLGTSLVMSVRPIQTEHLPSAAPMCRGHYLAVEGQQRVGIPARLKDGFLHGPTARFLGLAPYLHPIDPLQRLIRAQNQSRHIPADVCKPLIPAKQWTIRSQTSANRLWHPNNRQHALLPRSRLARLLLPSCIFLYRSVWGNNLPSRDAMQRRVCTRRYLTFERGSVRLRWYSSGTYRWHPGWSASLIP